MIKAFVQSITQLLNEPLPGAAAHQIMAPVARQVKAFDITDYPDARIGCVMLLFYPKGAHIYLALIKRPDYDGVHGGQISFPGGGIEQGDEDEVFTALRETQEEIGVKANLIKVLGQLSNVYIPPSNFFVFPFIGYTEHQPEFVLNDVEVTSIIEMPISILLQEEHKSTISINRKEITFEAPCYIFEGHAIWGATAIILSELEWLLRKLNANN